MRRASRRAEGGEEEGMAGRDAGGESVRPWRGGSRRDRAGVVQLEAGRFYGDPFTFRAPQYPTRCLRGMVAFSHSSRHLSRHKRTILWVDPFIYYCQDTNERYYGLTPLPILWFDPFTILWFDPFIFMTPLGTL